MGKYDSSAIRNLAFVGHGGSGKTYFSETLLKHMGLTTRVPAGIMDYASDEKEREHSIDASIASISWEGKEINIIDSPGYQEFFHNTVSALSVMETAVLFVSATDGVTVNTRRAWNAAQENKQPTIIVVTKVDSDNVSFEDTVEKIEETFGSKCIPLVVPNANSGAFSSVHNILKDQDAPSAADYKEKLTETTVETNDELLNRYLEGEEISDDELIKQLKSAIIAGEVVPILTVVATKDVGVNEFLEFVAEYAPSPVDVEPKEGKHPKTEETISFPAKEDAPFSAKIFKIYNDPFGRITYARVYSGTLKSASSIYDVNLGNSERVGGIFKVVGKEQKALDVAIPGDIIAFAKVENVQTNHTLATDKSPIVYPAPNYPVPMVSLAVFPKSRSDEQKIGGSIGKLVEEDQTFIAKRDEETAELVVSGMSNLHLEIMLTRLSSRFKVECTHQIPKIAYREAITGKAESRYRHKKQSGGHGQFGEVAIKIEPTERSEGFDFVNKIVGGVIPSQFIASTEKGIQATLEKGILAGYTIVDVRVTLFDGKTHDVDSSDAAFQIAGSKAFQEAFIKAKPVLLEPIQNVEISVPSQYMGDIMGDLNSRRGRIMGSDADGSYQIIKAQVPLAEIMTYSTELKSITGGEGTFALSFSHYDVVPSHLQDKIIAKAKADQEKK